MNQASFVLYLVSKYIVIFKNNNNKKQQQKRYTLWNIRIFFFVSLSHINNGIINKSDNLNIYLWENVRLSICLSVTLLFPFFLFSVTFIVKISMHSEKNIQTQAFYSHHYYYYSLGSPQSNNTGQRWPGQSWHWLCAVWVRHQHNIRFSSFNRLNRTFEKYTVTFSEWFGLKKSLSLWSILIALRTQKYNFTRFFVVV
jgi:hypothetical protein